MKISIIEFLLSNFVSYEFYATNKNSFKSASILISGIENNN